MSTRTSTKKAANPRPKAQPSNGFIKRHPIYSAVFATAGAVGIAAAGYFGHRYLTSDNINNAQPQAVYETVVGDTPVIYEEVVPSSWEIKTLGNRTVLSHELNRMTIKGIREYSLIDSLEETGIDFQKKVKPNFDKDKLEAMVISDKQWGVQLVYTANQIDDQTYFGEHVKKMFEIGNSLYNAVRNQIRSELIANQNTFQTNIENGLSGYQNQAKQANKPAQQTTGAQKEFIEGRKRALDKQMEKYNANLLKQAEKQAQQPKTCEPAKVLDNVRHGW